MNAKSHLKQLVEGKDRQTDRELDGQSHGHSQGIQSNGISNFITDPLQSTSPPKII